MSITMSNEELPPSQVSHIEDLVAAFVAERSRFLIFVQQLRLLADYPELSRYIHSVKWRVKDPEHLRDKLVRKAVNAKRTGSEFDITRENLFSKLNDLAGLRILHLYARQIEHVNRLLLEALSEQMYNVIDGPFARTWDDEYREYFKSIGIATQPSEKMYTSVHYVVEANTRSKITGEIQVRTLAEEIWGEVDHTINYPHESQKLACREQIRVLARVTSSCSRLVDAIFATHEEGGPTGSSVDERSGRI
jgi:putative GTP pyrophosphokinase